MSYVVVDVEADGKIPFKHSMVSFGAVIVEDGLKKTFYGKVRPISKEWIPEALAISKISREEHEKYDDPIKVMKDFADWLKQNSKGKPTFISDNLAFDWMWICWYFVMYYGDNPFGFSGRRIGDLYCGLMRDAGVNKDWKRKYRFTKHTHHPVDDAKGNAEALLAFRDKLGLKVQF